MTRVADLVESVSTDALRPPSPIDLSAAAYKDWLHFSAFDAEHGLVAVVNASLHGDPLSHSSLAVGTFLVHRIGDPELLVAAVQVKGLTQARMFAASLSIAPTAHLSLAQAGTFLAVSAHAGDAELHVTAEPDARAIEIETPVRFGSGWISWRAIPRMRLRGSIDIEGRRWSLDRAVGYHDHNWGRWFWGDDIGWRWGTFPMEDKSVTITVARRTDRQHRSGHAVAHVEVDGIARHYPRHTVTTQYMGRYDRAIRRLPGAVAALRSDRQRPDLPARVLVSLADGRDRADVDFEVDAAVQLVAVDPVRPGQTFVHELFGTFEATVTIGGRTVTGRGVAVFEHVD